MATPHQLDPHASRGWRLTWRSAIELVLAIGFGTGAIVLCAGGFLNLITRGNLAEVASQIHHGQIPAASERVAALRGDDATSVRLLRIEGPLAILTGRYDDAAAIGIALQDAAARAGASTPDADRWRQEGALLQAVALLHSDDGAAKAAEAKTLLQKARPLPEAIAALGQLALNDGDVPAATAAFNTVLAAASDPLPGRWALAVAYNGLAVCRLMTPAARQDPAALQAAFALLDAADAYRLPWSVPAANRDRVAALMLAAELRQPTTDNPESALQALARQLGYAPGETEAALRDWRDANRARAWYGSGNDGEAPAGVGRIDTDALVANHRALVTPLVAVLRAREAASRAASDGVTAYRREEVQPLLDELAAYLDAPATTPEQTVSRTAIVAAAMTVNDYYASVSGLDRLFDRELIGTILALREDAVALPIERQPSLAAIQLIAAAVDPEAVADGEKDPVALARWGLGALEQARQSEAAVATEVARFLSSHLEYLAMPGSFRDADEVARWAVRFAAHLPTQRIPDEAEALANPHTLPDGYSPVGPMLFDGRGATRASWLTESECAFVLVLWERRLRDVVDEAWRAWRRADEEIDPFTTALPRLLQAHLRMLGVMAAIDVEPLADAAAETTEDAEDLRDQAERRLEEVAEWDD